MICAGGQREEHIKLVVHRVVAVYIVCRLGLSGLAQRSENVRNGGRDQFGVYCVRWKIRSALHYQACVIPEGRGLSDTIALPFGDAMGRRSGRLGYFQILSGRLNPLLAEMNGM